MAVSYAVVAEERINLHIGATMLPLWTFLLGIVMAVIAVNKELSQAEQSDAIHLFMAIIAIWEIPVQ